MSSPQKNLVLGGKYRLLETIGTGGMGQVWKAEHLTLGSFVAIKVMSPELATTEEGRRRFIREAKVAAALRGNGIVQILDFGVQNDVPYIAMELLQGESLEERLRWMGRLSHWQTVTAIKKIGKAITRAHSQGVLHRDLKPANVFILSDGDDEELDLKLVDFGIARSRPNGSPLSKATNTGVFLGTPMYSSPEQAQGLRNVDHRTDIWSMGVIAFECLLGRTPFSGETPTQVLVAVCAGKIPIPSELDTVPIGFDAWFARACNRDVAARFDSAWEAARSLESALLGCSPTLSEEPKRQPPSPPWPEPSTSAPKRSTLGASSKNQPQHLQSALKATNGTRWRLPAILTAAAGLTTIGLYFTSSGDPSPTDAGISSFRPMPQVFGSLRVVGDENGPELTLTLDGTAVGVLPQSLTKLPIGDHLVKISGGSRYKPVSHTIIVSKDEAIQLGPFQLPVLTGSLELSPGKNSEGATLVLLVGDSSQKVPPLPTSLSIATGEVNIITAKRAGFEPFRQPIVFDDGWAKQTLQIDLKPLPSPRAQRKRPPALPFVSKTKHLSKPPRAPEQEAKASTKPVQPKADPPPLRIFEFKAKSHDTQTQTPPTSSRAPVASKRSLNTVSTASIGGTVARNTSTLKRTCWNGKIRSEGTPSSARILVSLKIGTNGNVLQAHSDAPDEFARLGRCIERQVRQWQFQKATIPTRVKIPLVFIDSKSAKPASLAGTGCNPPTFIDKKGIRRIKAECM